ncbi:hypothetical protein SAMN04487947_2994 [Halogeometricum rufum]|uniref:Uncharacterized protein n=1 Tax=Halogeometricum rufum TaxID=553469 RepID=A0A1I6I7C2_9EURY|nr:hypothetical protein SAMN04487947_2994 [Halogeometricum rufum]
MQKVFSLGIGHVGRADASNPRQGYVEPAAATPDGPHAVGFLLPPRNVPTCDSYR